MKPDTHKSQEEYIEHEVKLRLHDWKFKLLEHKLNVIVGLMLSNLIMPYILKHFGI